MPTKRYRCKRTTKTCLVLAGAGGLIYFTLSNIFGSPLRSAIHDHEQNNAKLHTHDASVETNSLDTISQGEGIDDNDNLATTETTATREGDEIAVRRNVSDPGNSQRQDKPPIISKKSIGLKAIIGTTHNYTEMIGPSNNDYMKNRSAMYDSWFEQGSDMLLENADKNGTILDFVIAGFPKCGTTTVVANLAYLAPLSVSDVCTPPSQITYYAYKSWPKQYGNQKLLRGSKCPKYIGSEDMKLYSKHLPRTKMIIGIRHPVLWIQSFWNMQVGTGFTKFLKNNPYMLVKTCKPGHKCNHGCPNKWLFCIRRARFHVQLAALGKTSLSMEERKVLAPNDNDGGENLRSQNIRNPIFLYEQKELSKDYVWDEMAKYLNVSKIPHDKHHSSHGRTPHVSINFCEERFDDLRAIIMPYAYELSVWMQNYFIPVAKNESAGVTIPNPNALITLVEEYKKDPCDRLYRLKNGTYVLNTNRTAVIENARS